jgi:hypothetical protein
MDEPQMNLWAVLIAAVVAMVIGRIWYADKLFGGHWRKLTQVKSPENKYSCFFCCLILSLLTAYVLALFEMSYEVTNWVDGMFVGFLAWLGFSMPQKLGKVVYQRCPAQLFFIESGGKLVMFLAMGGILGS